MKNEKHKTVIIRSFPFYKKGILSLLLLTISVIAGAATFTVTNINDSGLGSLRKAISDANITSGNHIINLNISGMAPHTITLASALPNITRSNLIIDGTTQPANGYTGYSPKIILNINSASRNGITFYGGNGYAVYGLLIINGQRGINLYGAGSVTIGAVGKGNVLSGNQYGIFIDNGSHGTTIKGNLIGTDTSGIVDAGNSSDGIFIASSNNTIIGGALTGERNIISENNGNGITVDGTATSGTIIKGNYIGTDINGTIDNGNNGSGIVINSTSSNGTIGGNLTGEGNTISGNDGNGIFITGTSVAWSNIKGNFIGTDKTGTNTIGNSGDGIHIATATSATITIGGNGSGDGNVISGNGGDGIEFNNATSPVFSVKGNIIGTGITGMEELGNNQYGILIKTRDVQIGGTNLGDGNSIAFNKSEGVKITGGATSSIRNKIQQNSIYCNSQNNGIGGILLNNGNNNIAAPVITTTNSTTVSGTSASNVLVEIFNDDACPNCEGKYFIGSTIANGSGQWSFTGSFCNSNITATATADNKGTSQFSSCGILSSCNQILDFIYDSTDTFYISDTVIFTNISTGFLPGTRFIWTFEDCFLENIPTPITDSILCSDTTTGTNAPIVHVYNKSGILKIKLTAIDCEGNELTSKIKSIRIFIIDPDCSFDNSVSCNLICNGDFEHSSDHVCLLDQVYLTDYWNTLFMEGSCIENPPTRGTTDYFNDNYSTCGIPNICSMIMDVPVNYAGNQASMNSFTGGTGLAYTGVFAYNRRKINNVPQPLIDEQNYREYIHQELGTALIAGNPYLLEFFVNLSDKSAFASNGMGMRLTVNSIVDFNAPNFTLHDDKIVNLPPQLISQSHITDKDNWTRIHSDCFIPDSNYKWVLLGSFTDDNSIVNTYPGITNSFINCVQGGTQQQIEDAMSYYYIDNVAIKPLPGIQVSINGNTIATLCDDGEATVCAGIPVTLVATGNGPYLWSTGATTQSITVVPTSTTTYSVSVSPNGCSGNVSITLNVIPSPQASISSPVTICSGNCAALTAGATGGTTPYAFTWNFPQIGSGPHSVCPAVTTPYTVTVTDANGCSAKATTTVTIDNLDIALGPDITICSNQCLNISSNRTGGVAPFTYLWSAGQTTPSLINVCPVQSTSYTVTVTDAIGCSATDSRFIEIDGDVANAGNDKEICQGKSVIIGPETGNANCTFQWSPATGLSSTTVLNPTATPAVTTIYTVTCTTSNGCTSTSQMDVYVNPTPTATVEGTTKSGCSSTMGGTGSVTASGGNPPLIYSWNTSPVQTSQIATGLSAGTYTVTVTDEVGCTVTASVTIEEATNCSPNIIEPEMIFADCIIWLKCDFLQSFNTLTQTFFQLDIYPVDGGPNTSSPFGPLSCGTSFSVVNSLANANGTASQLTPVLFVNDEDLLNVNNVLPLCHDPVLPLINVLDLMDLPDFNPPVTFFLKGATYNFKFLIRDDIAQAWIEKNVCLTIPDILDCADYRSSGPAKRYDKPVKSTTKSTANTKALNVAVFPNPTVGVFTLYLLGEEENVQIVLYDVTGRIVYEKKGIVVNGESKIPVDISDFSQGVYYLKTFSNYAVHVNKIIYKK